MSVYLREARATLRLALPIVVGQVSQMLMGVTDSMMIGRLGAVPLAASAFVGGVFAFFYVVGIGLLLPVAVLVSREHGAGDDRAGARWLQHGVALAALASLLGMAALFGLQAAFHLMGQPPEVLAAVQPYYALIATSLLPVLVFQVFRQFSEAMGRPWMPMAIMLAGVAINVGLNWILIYGHLGAPALGLAGAGAATLLSRIAVLAAIVVWLRQSEVGRHAWPETWGRGLCRARFGDMLHIGVPAALMMCLEVGAFVTAALMMGWLGTVALAAHQIALSCVAFMFMFPLGLSMAVGMRVSRAVGEGRPELLRPIAGGALAMSCAIMSVSAVVFSLAGSWLAGGFVHDPEVVALAVRLLVVAAIFQLFDGAQVIGSGALRGLSDVRVPAMFSFIAYWLLAIPGGYLLGLHTTVGAVGIWIGLASGLAVTAVLMAWRFLSLTK
ncbi:MAG: MATE family efflux transporter [Opitutaceae bacterium]|jgi:MATE family multidrug resistance protein